MGQYIAHIWIGYIFIRNGLHKKARENKEYPAAMVSSLGIAFFFDGLFMLCVESNVFDISRIRFMFYHIIIPAVIIAGIIFDLFRFKKYGIEISFRNLFKRQSFPLIYLFSWDIWITTCLLFILVITELIVKGYPL